MDNYEELIRQLDEADVFRESEEKMEDYKEPIEDLRALAEWAEANLDVVPIMLPVYLEQAANTIKRLVKERDTLRNELCLRCGEYIEAHNGACKGCRWRND